MMPDNSPVAIIFNFLSKSEYESISRTGSNVLASFKYDSSMFGVGKKYVEKFGNMTAEIFFGAGSV